jgi:hypothetical protein
MLISNHLLSEARLNPNPLLYAITRRRIET